MDEKLGKPLKLKSKKRIGQLFDEGESVKAFPLLLVYKTDENLETSFQVGFSVSKRNFKNAVDRNRIKRLLREYFRKNKYLFTLTEEKQFLFMFIFIGKRIPSYQDVEGTMQKIARKFTTKIQSID